MKIWNGYSSEHSTNLVMIGRFEDAKTAAEVKWSIDQFSEHVLAETEAGRMEIGARLDRFSATMLDLLQRLKFYDLSPAELEQFGYDFRLRLDDKTLVLTTDESDVSVFLKILIGRGALVEVYSAHQYPDREYARGD